jgi:acyl-CoA synthetase (AMP-forming)/AMP-acid ligase II/acyl carrier protein
MHIFNMLEEQAKRIPELPAISSPGREHLSYRRLYTHVENVVMWLNEMGLERNDRVALVLHTSGTTSRPKLVPLSHTNLCLSAHNIGETLKLTGSDEAGIDSPAMAAAKSRGIPVIYLSPILDADAGIFRLSGIDRNPRDLRGPTKPDDVALVLHTSGTTSRPKIVPLTHTNLCLSAHNIGETLKLTGSDVCLNVMPLFHIHGLIGAVLSSLMAGARIVCTPGFDLSKFFKWMSVYRPTWYTAVPTIHQAVIANARNNSNIISHSPLRFIRSSSSALPPNVMAELESIFHSPVVEAYGMTEASHQIASNPLPPLVRKPGSVGVAVGPEVAIMDESGNFLSSGKSGEIVLRGGNVMSGYENNPEANSGAFTKGWFRTGDLGFLDEDGYLVINGRIKEIINRGGRKISPREVDDVLIDHPEIVQALTFSIPHPTLGEDVAAAVVLHEDSSLVEKDIRDFAFSRLADFKVPTKVLVLNDIPKGATGKPQRIGLADKLSHMLRRDFVAPGTRVERVIIEIWEEVLEVGNIGIYDNFFMLGGDSLKATQVVSRVREIFKVELPPPVIFQSPTVKELAGVIEAQEMKGEDEEWIARVLSELEDLSDEEAERLLAEESQSVQQRETPISPHSKRRTGKKLWE